MTSDSSNPPSDSVPSPETIAPPQASPEATSSAVPAKLPTQPVVARAGQYYRNTRYIMAALTVVMGFWFGYDGFVRWPAENATIAQLKQVIVDARQTNNTVAAADAQTELKRHSEHSATDLQFQKILAFALPPLGVVLLIWALYNSRGEYRLAENTLHVPGHPPIPLSTILELDEASWDRKGIAVIRYQLATGQNGTAKLDDFVYDRPPTDDIYELIKAHVISEMARQQPAV